MARGGADEVVAQHILRITDIAKEPLEYLIPITGFAKTPLVSLEKAVEPLIDILPDVQSYAFVAKQRCKSPTDGLTQDESASIMLYTMPMGQLDKCLYNILNQTLRDKDRQQKLEPWYFYIKLFLNGFLRLKPIQKRCTEVFHSISAANISDERPLFGETGARTMFYLGCQNLRDIRKHSYIPNEDEMLLLPATEFKVKGVLRQDDLHLVHLKEVPSNHPLLQPIEIILPTSVPPSAESKPTMKNQESTDTTISQKFPKIPKPKHKNEALKALIAENQIATELNLSWKNLTDQDIEKVADSAIQENQVYHSDFF